jgi:hypothetical protein
VAAYVGDSNWMHGPLVLSRHPPEEWATLRARALAVLEPLRECWPVPHPALNVDLGEPVVVLPRGTQTAWHPRPFGGYLARMDEVESCLAHEKAASWAPTGIPEGAWKPTPARLVVDGPLYLVDFAARRDAVAESLRIDLAPGTYLVDVAEGVKPVRARTFTVLRLRSAAAPPEALATGPAPRVEPEPSWTVDAGARALAKGARFAESEGGPLLLVPGEALPSWRGIETDDYDRACACSEGGDPGSIQIGAIEAVVLATPDPAALLPVGDQVLIVRMEGADKPVDAIAAALATAADEARWRPTPIAVQIGASAVLYVIDSAEDGAALARRKRLPGSAARVELAAGAYRLESAGELRGVARDRGRVGEVMLTLHRLRRE